MGYLRQPRWICGFILYMACQGLNLVAMGMAPLVVLSSLGSWCLISNALWARALLGERLRWREVASMLGTVVGVVLVIQTTPSAGDPFPGDLNRMNESFTSPRFLGTSIAFFVMLLVLFGVTHHYLRFRPAAWALASAVLSGYTVMLWKCLSLLVVSPVPGTTALWLRLEPYLISLFGNLVGAGQVHTMNCGLKLASPLLVVPIFYTLGMLVQMAVGSVFFGELNNFSDPFAMARFWAGTLVLLVCIFFLTKFQTQNQKLQRQEEEAREQREQQQQQQRQEESANEEAEEGQAATPDMERGSDEQQWHPKQQNTSDSNILQI